MIIKNIIHFSCIIGFISCTESTVIELHNIQDKSYYLTVTEDIKTDTIYLVKEPLEIVSKKVKADSIRLVVKSDLFYDYLQIDKESKKWNLNENKSKRLISNVNESLEFD